MERRENVYGGGYPAYGVAPNQGRPGNGPWSGPPAGTPPGPAGGPPGSGPAAKKKGPGTAGIVLLALFGTGLFLGLLLCMLMFFFRGVSVHFDIPRVWIIAGGSLTRGLARWYAIVIAVVPASVSLLVMVLSALRRFRRFFLAAGISLVATALGSFALVLLYQYGAELLNNQWFLFMQKIAGAYRDFFTLCGVALLALGAICISAYACIAAVKGGSHE